MVINGENYHALESLLFCYAGKVDCIYIDPPYNTGAKDWKYNNDYVDGSDEYRHSKWLAMVERRLLLAKQLLNPERSVLICAIDEKEYLRLGLLLEQLFPSGRTQMISSVINPTGTQRPDAFNRTDEYLYIVRLGDLPIQPSIVASDEPVEVDWRTFRRQGSDNLRPTRPNQFYPIYVNDSTKKIVKIGSPITPDTDRFSVEEIPGCTAVFPVKDDGTEMMWSTEPEETARRLEKGYIRVGRHNPNKPQQYILQYLYSGKIEDIETGKAEIRGHSPDGSIRAYYVNGREVMPTTQWNHPSHNSQTQGSALLKKMLGDSRFPFPKSLYAVEDTIRFFVADKPNALILDFFSGSGTTAHAVMRLNHQDGGNRRCICVTNNEVSAEEATKLTKQGKRQGDPEWEELGICEYITKPRVTAAITGKTPKGEPIKGDYKFTDEFSMADGFEENAIFYDLTYLDPNVVSLGVAFEEIAPLLWLRAGSKGSVIEREDPKGYALAETYTVLFDYAHAKEFFAEIGKQDSIQTVFIVTDDENRYESACKALKGRDVVRLYESYLRSFKIAAEGAVI